MDWMPVIGNVLGSVASGLFGASNASAQMEKQNAMQVQNYKHRYQWSVEDMRAAGLNPILAATNGISGNVQGVSVPSINSSSPDFASALSSAFQTSSQKEIAKMQNDVAKEDLRLKEMDLVSAKEKRDNDIVIENGRFKLEKYVQEAAVKRADALNDATIQNMKDRLEAEIEHWARSDMNGASMAAAAIQSANAAGLQAEVARQLGISKSAVMAAEEAYIGLQSENAEENLKWQRWLNDHPETRGAVGFLGALFDTVATWKGVKNLGNSVADMVD